MDQRADSPDAPETVREDPHPPRRRSVRGILVGVLVLLLVLGGIGAAVFVHASADRSYDAALERSERSVAEAEAARDGLQASARNRADTAVTAQEIVSAAGDDLVDPAARAALVLALEETSAAVTRTEAVAGGWTDEAVPAKPFWTWELTAGADALTARDAAAVGFEADADAAEAALDDAEDALVDAATALYATVPPIAAALEQANISAVATTVLDLRDAAAALAGQTTVSPDAASAVSDYAARAVALRESGAAELAEKAGPQQDTRLEIEEYARSISGGVVLDFDWTPTAAGVGGPNAIGGTATWDASRGGFSTITFSHSVADWWPQADARALVTHEVGHAITAKCWQLFDSSSAPANEEWATAWAIGMGQTAPGNGVQAYGYPSQEMIDLARGCR